MFNNLTPEQEHMRSRIHQLQQQLQALSNYYDPSYDSEKRDMRNELEQLQAQLKSQLGL